MSFRACFASAVAAGAIAGARLNAQQIIVRSVGPGPVGPRLVVALAAPHDLIGPAPTPALLRRDSTYARTVIVLQRDAVIEGRVHGDVIVVGGNAFMHPGAIVDGRVVAIGGGVYESFLAIVREGTESYRDFTFDAQRVGGTYVLVYRSERLRPSPPISFPGVYGIRIPSYDRSDGLSLPFGPTISLDTGRYELDPTVTYRSNLGAFDPALDGDLILGRRARAHLFVGRTTLTNDGWIWSDLVNSAATFFRGLDTRNYYRADRAEVIVYRPIDGSNLVFEPFLGARAERDRSVGPDSLATGGPWSIFDRTETDAMLRPNPPIIPGDLSSVLFGARFEWEVQRVLARFELTNEAAAFSVGSLRFLQSTFDGEVRFPTFGTQRFTWSTHVVYTFGDIAPPQRWSYLGGSGTLITLPLLSLGGDRLVYFESDYDVPIQALQLPLLGSPTFTLRHIVGSAGIGTLPSFEQNLALRVALSFFRADIAVDPARRSWMFAYGLSAAR